MRVARAAICRCSNMKRERTAKDEQDLLDRDLKYQAMLAEKRWQWAEQADMLRRDEAPLVGALIAAGVRLNGKGIESVWDLVNTAEPYPHLLDTLVEHVTRPYHVRTREGIVRALAVREAKGTRVPRLLMNELKKQTDPSDGPNSYRWVLINTLVFIGDRSLGEDVRLLVNDSRYGMVRRDLERLARAIRRKGRG